MAIRGPYQIYPRQKLVPRAPGGTIGWCRIERRVTLLHILRGGIMRAFRFATLGLLVSLVHCGGSASSSDFDEPSTQDGGDDASNISDTGDFDAPGNPDADNVD